MTFYDISATMLRANFKRYKLYFLCNLFSVMLFYCFAAIFTNKSFMDSNIVNPMISSNIIAPSLFAGIFLVLFLPYSYHAFLRNRKQEYGVFMTLGMSETQVLQNMLLENCMIAGISLIIGLLLGTVISFVFYFIIRYAIGISGLNWYFNPASYGVTALLYAVTILLTLLIGILKFMKMKITDLLKEKYTAEKQRKPLPGRWIAGLVFIVAAVGIGICGYGIREGKRELLSLGFMFVGSLMLVTDTEKMKQYFLKIMPGYRQQHIVELSLVRQHQNSRSRISIIAAWMIGFSILMTGLCAVMNQSIIHNAFTYTPYDLVYSEFFGMNEVPDHAIKALLHQNDVAVKSVKQVNYLRGRAFNLLPVSEVNKEFNCNYQIPEGKFLMVFQYAQNDGYEHDLFTPHTVTLECVDKDIQLVGTGSDIRILFNDNPAFADQTLVLNDTDYHKAALEDKDFWKGIMKLYAFDDWKNSGKGVNAVQKYLWKKNHIGKFEQNRYYRATSRIETYTMDKQSAQFLIFLLSFLVILFCGAADILIHFTIKAESEEEQRVLYGLYRIGVTAKELLRILRYKNLYYYMPQVIIGLLIGGFYNYVFNKSFGYGLKSIMFSLLTGMILAALQLGIIKKYSQRELSDFNI